MVQVDCVVALHTAESVVGQAKGETQGRQRRGGPQLRAPLVASMPMQGQSFRSGPVAREVVKVAPLGPWQSAPAAPCQACVLS